MSHDLTVSVLGASCSGDVHSDFFFNTKNIVLKQDNFGAMAVITLK